MKIFHAFRVVCLLNAENFVFVVRQRSLNELNIIHNRAERFKNNVPVKINEGSPSKKKIVLRKAEKRSSGDANKEPDDISPIKTIKIEKGLDVTTVGAAQPSGDTPEVKISFQI